MKDINVQMERRFIVNMKKGYLLSLLMPLLASCSGSIGKAAYISHRHEIAEVKTFVEYEASCTTDGLSVTRSYCECGELMRTQYDTIPALGHDYIHVDEVESTCEIRGICEHDYCKRCGYESYYELPLSDHHLEETEIIENNRRQTCFQTGSYDIFKRCIDCGEDIFVKHVDLGKLEHDWVHHDDLDPTCSAYGYLEYDECSLCGEKTIVYLPQLEHSESEWIFKETKKQPTCTESGVAIYVKNCLRCGKTVRESQLVLSPLGHNFVHHDHLDPTCTTEGHEQYDACSRCGYHKPIIAINKIEHKPYKSSQTVNNSGSYPVIVEEYRCSECNTLCYRENISPLVDWYSLESYSYKGYAGRHVELNGVSDESNIKYTSDDVNIAYVRSGTLYFEGIGSTIIRITSPNKEDYSFIYVVVNEEQFSFSFSNSNPYEGEPIEITDVWGEGNPIFWSGDEKTAKVIDNKHIETYRNGSSYVYIYGYWPEENVLKVKKLDLRYNSITVTQNEYNWICNYEEETLSLEELYKTSKADSTIKITYSGDTSVIAVYGGYIHSNKNGYEGTVYVTIRGDYSGYERITINVRKPVITYYEVSNSNYSNYISREISIDKTVKTMTITFKTKANYRVSTLRITFDVLYEAPGSHGQSITTKKIVDMGNNENEASIRFPYESLYYTVRNFNYSGHVFTAV